MITLIIGYFSIAYIQQIRCFR